MGNCCPSEKKKKKKRGTIKEQLIENDSRSTEKKETIRVLLLGAGESGKTTFFKQMRLIQDEGFSKDDLNFYKNQIQKSCISSMKILVSNAERLNYNLEKIEQANLILQTKKNSEFTKEIGLALQLLWKDEAIGQTFLKRNTKFHLNDSMEFFFDSLERISQPDYIPTNEDVLRCRTTTVSVDEAEFQLDDFHFTLIDVGGQRNERRKWSYCYDKISTVIFFVSLIGYSQVLFEDNSTNRMSESLALFRDVVQSPWFAKSLIVVYLNKKDLFEKQIHQVDLGTYFKEYKGGANYDNAIEFVQDQFYKVGQTTNERYKKEILTYPTCALNTEDIRDVTKLTLGKVLNNDLDDLGFL
ncbi:guanine nucleotide-binding protein g(o) subunit alpha [Anaeramoeba flamelloides]|uniref:Guanine nucleotide-binding protein g(O) subunit alpha n=1 Tax=Anaeramoeba flamelloides TaxID=1746091 RepID=A0ABQ8XMZ5_9EUKA|nr:guanine nucleotide-binding protein g(o) subunit alpha [Anaeramoeba flamelloides]